MVVATKLKTSITLTFNQGLDGDGKVILKNGHDNLHKQNNIVL